MPKGKFNSNPESRPQIKRIQQLHQNIIRLHFLGYKKKDIAATLKVSPVTVSYTLASPIVQRELSTMNAVLDEEAFSIRQRIEELKPLALDNISDILTSEDAPWTVKRAAAMDVLGELGGESVPKSLTINNSLTVNDISEMKKRAVAQARTMNMAVSSVLSDEPSQDLAENSPEVEDVIAVAVDSSIIGLT